MGDKPASGSGRDCSEEPKAVKSFACGSGTKTAYEHLKVELEAQLPYLPKHCLVDIRKMVVAQFVKRFKRSRIPKYGSLNKGFTESELQQFSRHVTNPKFHLLFSYQANLGLRLGEAIKINVKDIKFESRELVVKTEKAMTLDTLLIPALLFQATMSFIEEHSEAIKAQGCILLEGESKLEEPHVAENYVRKRFSYHMEKIGLLKVYDQSDKSRPDRAARNLHKLTTHSLRHYAITHFAEQTNGNVFLTSKFARHSKPTTTMAYIRTDPWVLYRNIDRAFGVSQAVALKARFSIRN